MEKLLSVRGLAVPGRHFGTVDRGQSSRAQAGVDPAAIEPRAGRRIP